MLVFQLGEDRFAIESRRVVEIVPSLALREMPHAPECVAGVFSYRGAVVPVIDVCSLIRERTCRPCLSTRIMLVRIDKEESSSRLVGLRVEHLTETLRVSEGDLVSPGIDVAEAPYLGKIINDAHGMIQCIRLERLLPESLSDLLFQEVTERA